MSHAVMRGAATKAQLYLDGILDELVAETGRQEDRYCLAKILYKCLRDNPHDIRQIEGDSGAVDTNRIVLERSVRTALALKHAGLQPGDTVLVISRNNLEMSGIFFGAMFAGVVLYFLNIGLKAYELKHFFDIKKPDMIFMESETLPSMEQCLRENNLDIKIILFGQNDSSSHQSFSSFISGFDEGIKDFWPVDTDRESPVVFITTSGSTGLPKAAVLSNMGLVAQMPSLWTQHERFPRPTAIYMCLTNSSWITHTCGTIMCVAYRNTILYTTANINVDHLRMLFRKYKPTAALMAGFLGVAMLSEQGGRPDDLSSLDTLCLAGSALPEHVVSECLRHIRPDGRVYNIYGMTEIHGVATIPRRGAPLGCLGTVLNCLDFKIVDGEGHALGPNQLGELWFKSDHCTFKEYVNNEKAYKDSFAEDGWFRTGDSVYMNEHEDIFFVERIKFMIKYKSHQISPSEVEEVITRLDGVHSAAVCEAERGPAALVVPRSGHTLTPRHIHDAVSSTLSDVKRLRGGVVFVESIPLSANGKLNRNDVKLMFQGCSENQIHYDK